MNRVAATLLRSDAETFDNDLWRSMDMIAAAVKADRVYIWKNYAEENGLHCTQLYEWSEGAEPMQNTETVTNVLYSDIAPEWEETLTHGRCINGIVREMSPNERAALSPQGILSVLVEPVFVGEEFWGFVGLDDCHHERKFTENEEFILRSASFFLVNAIMRNDMTRQNHAAAAQLEVALKRAQDASRAKSNFLAKMSHEIRTPMNAIIGMTELALREKMSDTAREHNLTIRQAGANLLSIINDILDFSKIESGNMELTPREYQLSTLIHDVVCIIRTRMSESRLRFLVNVDCNIPNTLFGDEIRIRQILLNLLVNAVKYTDKGFISFSVVAKMTGMDMLVLNMEVADSGKGIKAENLGSLFREFVQFDADSNKGIEGTGLGLAITRSLVKAMGGDISVSSEYGQGSKFSVTLPQKIRGYEKLASVKNPLEKRVLIFERRKIYADSIRETADNLGVTCTLVEAASDFYFKLVSNEYSFVFLAVGLYQSVKEMYPALESKAKIILVAEFGESVSTQNLSVLHTPIYSVPVANILNDTADRYTYGDFNMSVANFTAPDVKILIVDDIQTNLKVAEGLMLPYQMQVKLCTGGEEALLEVQRERYDMVFMDQKMPKMDGIEATRRIRALGSKDDYYKKLTIIALTANAVSGTKELFLLNGFDDFLTKPVDMVSLSSILEKWIPTEKRGGPPGRFTEMTEERNTADEIKIEIEGIDVGRGVYLSGGKPESYLETLAVFYRDGLLKIREITACLETGNLPLYTVYVHALKSASANIGAASLSASAETLEAAGEHRDTGFIGDNTGKFLADLESLLGRINDTITALKGPAGSVDMNVLQSELSKLKASLESLDAGVINQTVEDLEKYSDVEGIGAQISSISEKVLNADYDEAIALIDILLKREP